ncbi:hypothetical protein [Mycolicibacterium frederiksbergense]|uniref:hypothetical protein n=1 Tax=Mycolicibacterium frederiksbergense TaxID=117567 RepID=UPI00399A78BB
MTLRRRLLLYSAPVVLVVLILVVKLVSVVVAGNAALNHFSESDATALADDAGTLQTLNIIEPEKAHYVAGTAAVLRNRLDEADRQFSLALDRTDHDESCAVRINLELVRETRGDSAAAMFQAQAAAALYLGAKQVIAGAPADCVDAGAAARLDAKIAAVTAPPPPPPPSPPPVPTPVAPAPGSAPTAAQDIELDPGQGDPLEKLQQILRDAATR